MTTKATRATIRLGLIELDCYLMPDGEYKYNQSQAFISIADEDYDTKQAAKRYIEIATSKTSQTLLGRQLQPGEISKYKGGIDTPRSEETGILKNTKS